MTAAAAARSTRTARSASNLAATPTANTETPAGNCRAGRCDVPAARSCAPHKGCTGSRCATSCGSDSQCSSGNVCTAGDCGKRPTGSGCSTGGQCATGICAQGRCCATPCSGSCKTCARAGQEGTCTNVAVGGADPTNSCRDDACENGCDGQGGCRREATGTTCGAATCSGNARALRVCSAGGACETRNETCPTATPLCTGAGRCVAPTPMCTPQNCSGPCRAGCVADKCVLSPEGSDCEGGGKCNRTGACLQCLPGAKRCNARVPQTCSAAGSWTNGNACSGACLEGNCVACTPGAKRCSTRTPQTCSAAGAWVSATICPNACLDAACVDCTPGARRCTVMGGNATRQMCSSAGSWGSNAVCAGGCNTAGDDCAAVPTCNATACAAMGPCRECKPDGTCGSKTSGSCDDKNGCTTGDMCNAMGACVGTARTCNTPGTCEKAEGATCTNGACVYPADTGGACNDNDGCTTGETCNAQKQCRGGTTRTCDSPGTCETARGPGARTGRACTGRAQGRGAKTATRARRGRPATRRSSARGALGGPAIRQGRARRPRGHVQGGRVRVPGEHGGHV